MTASIRVAWILVSAGLTVFAQAPTPLLAKGHPVDWWFMFKFNAAAFPGCAGTAQRACIFGGEVQTDDTFSQQYVFASSDHPALQPGGGCAGDTVSDPLGATFDGIYNGTLNYVIWNDQFYNDPLKNQGGPWGHSKGILAWDNTGAGLVLQVSTPSWPRDGSKKAPPPVDGNTLGCVSDNNVLVSQHFFALTLTAEDVAKVLQGLQHSSVVTDVTKPQIVGNGGPANIKTLVNSLGVKATDDAVTIETLSSGVRLISKPSALNVPPWQMVSSVLGGISLRAATWWTHPSIEPTTAATTIACWSPSLKPPGAVDIAKIGHFGGKAFDLTGGPGSDSNHAKIGVSTSGTAHLAIFGDLNQQGSLSGSDCASSQNGRGGLFYVVDNTELFTSVAALIQ